MKLKNRFLAVAMATMSLCTVGGVISAIKNIEQPVFAMAEESQYTAEVYKDITLYNADIGDGKEFATGTNIVDATWIGEELKVNNGFEFKMSMSQADWDAMPGKDSTWYEGSWGAPARDEGAIQITLDGYQELIMYKNAAGKLAINSKNHGDGTKKTVVLDGYSFAGEHTYKYVNVAGVAGGAETRVYIDGTLVFTHSANAGLGGNHCIVYNHTG